MRVSDFSYDLPPDHIALTPPKTRGTSRLLVLNRSDGSLEHRRYQDIADYLEPGDVVVLNDTKVIKARLIATNQKGQKRELLLLEDHHNTDSARRRCLYRGSLHVNEILDVKGIEIRITAIHEGGIAVISADVNLLDLAEKEGQVPLPPYLRREATEEDTSRYQTVFARESGSVAAPTASLNFTHDLEKRLRDKGVGLTFLTLHVGLGTFLPIRTDEVEAHHMHSEYFEIPKHTVAVIKKAKAEGRRVVAIGTTVARTLEFAAVDLRQSPQDLSGEANIFIYPGYEFKIVDALVTNFHAPKTTVLMLVTAFACHEPSRTAGWENLKLAYEEAIKENYAFLSYGDSMLIL